MENREIIKGLQAIVGAERVITDPAAIAEETKDAIGFRRYATAVAVFATGLGLLMSSILNSQIAAIFGTTIATLLPAIQFSGLTHPVSAQRLPPRSSPF